MVRGRIGRDLDVRTRDGGAGGRRRVRGVCPQGAVPGVRAVSSGSFQVKSSRLEWVCMKTGVCNKLVVGHETTCARTRWNLIKICSRFDRLIVTYQVMRPAPNADILAR